MCASLDQSLARDTPVVLWSSLACLLTLALAHREVTCVSQLIWLQLVGVLAGSPPNHLHPHPAVGLSDTHICMVAIGLIMV